MTTPNLAKIERVPDLRATWPNEAQHFTPWLAENIAELGEALGMDLELQQTEAPVGGYSLDILANDLGSSRPVIIENQLEATNHGHLGQLLTYAAGFDAETVVWVTRDFRDEHRQALDWLNQRTGENTQFFGVVIELLRIDDSRLAPFFRVVASPNSWRKETVTHGDSNLDRAVSAQRERYRKYFQNLIDTLREKHRFTNARTAQPSSWYTFSSGYSGIRYGASFTGQKQAKIELNIDYPDRDRNVSLLTLLKAQSEDIERQIGHSLVWEALDGRRVCRIMLLIPGSIDDDDDTLEEIQNWMTDHLLKFREAFSPHLAQLTKQL